ncbi:MBL fold metallo-hydrolase [Thermoleophilia bacterium SCSIO 60948]|nr:MBL fold metallo-hydrolase [Thermoleophilia bacterium SCSIO 60948]
MGRRDTPRIAALAGCAAGLAAAPMAGEPSPLAPFAAAVAVGALAALARSGDRRVLAPSVCMAAVLAGLTLGSARTAAIDEGAFTGPAGDRGELTGFVSEVPDRDDGEVRVVVEGAEGRVEVRAPEPVGELPVGGEVSAEGVLRAPSEFEADRLADDGIEQILQAGSIETTGARRGGLAGAIDSVRVRSEDALGRGAPEAEAALLRGFVLGQDERIDPRTEEDFRRSGLSHLLAVSGQNVLLLAILAMAVLALLGVSLRDRLLIVIALIAIYVPVAGAGPSILRAGAMGVAGLLAALAGRPASRWYALAGAALFTLALDPRATGDVGWQLSFAAVIGILAFAAPLRDLLLPPPPRMASPLRRGVVEGIAVTLAATLATAPLMAATFGAFSLTSLLANLLVLPAVAPIMWLGMAAAFLGQIPAVPVEPLVWLAARLAGYVEQVAHLMAAPSWAEAELEPLGIPAVLASYLTLAVAATVGLAVAARRRGLGSRRWVPRPAGRTARISLHLAAGLVLAGVLATGSVALLGRAGPGSAPGREAPLTVTVLDVGQGDAILVEPRDRAPLLIDAGPAGADLPRSLAEHGVEALDAVLVSHADDDHVGGLGEVLESIPAARIVRAAPSRRLREASAAFGAREQAMTRGEVLRSGRLSLKALWPPPELARRSPGDRSPVLADERNGLGLVLLLRWRRFTMLLPGDAEAEAVPLDPGPIDVLKLAHHGSADAGLSELLERSEPELGVASVGAENAYGHPTPETLAAASDHGLPVARTDRDGDIEIEVRRTGWSRIE